ncbi:VOC family protein [Marinospirillum alkaliphilum]|uniref:Catechol 2,3-dioxygenase n=1 Tax=Marinospirillum alkaliphilum DSM 21637 TaxID=1122209 RepID=A0A1K1YDC5_9GAMM|nr:VOC family protein [Marinospirillum alkaliphilum]SFX60018.1 Catechol 2,3-dioxygenase [Marinospirillum alkaliphilum DSM 21637]
MIQLQQIHHVAYRCKDAKETMEWYRRMLNMKFLLAISEDRVPSTGAEDPYMHIFLDAGGGNILAFFELPQSPPMGRDTNTPEWVQHIAFELADEQALLDAMDELRSKGVEVLGPTDHGIIRSIYFFDPNGHRLELTCRTGTSEQLQLLEAVAPLMLEEWSLTRKAPRHAAWLHQQQEDQT